MAKAAAVALGEPGQNRRSGRCLHADRDTGRSTALVVGDTHERWLWKHAY